MIALLLVAALAGPAPAFERSEVREPCAVVDPVRRPFFGDLHVHTGYSLDAATQGVRTRPDDAYRFARGETIGLPPYDQAGEPLRTLRLRRPLDFAAVTDHAELFGEREICDTPGLPGYDSFVCRVYRRWPRLAFFFMNARSTRDVHLGRYRFCGPGGADCLDAARGPWGHIQEAAEAHYDRTAACRFTTFVGYEWTGVDQHQEPAPQRDLPHRRGAVAAGQLFRSVERRGPVEGVACGMRSMACRAATSSPSPTTRI